MEDSIHSKIVAYNQLTKELEELYQLYAKKSGLSETTLWILYCVHERQEPYTQKELCDIWSYSRQTINSALKNLETQGLIELVPLPENRKNKQLLLTASGKNLVNKIILPLVEAEKNVFIQLGEEDSRKFLSLTKRHTELLHMEINQILKSSSANF